MHSGFAKYNSNICSTNKSKPHQKKGHQNRQPKPHPQKPQQRHQCTAEELSTGQLIAKVMKFVDENSMHWNDIFQTKKWSKSREIEGIYERKGKGRRQNHRQNPRLDG
jgi:hypothetical protein